MEKEEVFAKIEVATPEEDVSRGVVRPRALEWYRRWYLWKDPEGAQHRRYFW